jgi:hypothetical protein
MGICKSARPESRKISDVKRVLGVVCVYLRHVRGLRSSVQSLSSVVLGIARK